MGARFAGSHGAVKRPPAPAPSGEQKAWTLGRSARGPTDLCAHPFAGGSWAWDGEAWKAKPFEPTDCERTPNAIVHGPLGFVETTSATGEVYGIWRSSDGLTWTKVAPPEPGFLQLNGVVVIGGRYVVAGRSSDGLGVVWWSSDLETWKRASFGTLADFPFLVATSKLALAAWEMPDGTTTTWTSADGVTWSAGDPLPAGSFGAPWAIGDDFVEAGRISGASRIPSIWVGTPTRHGVVWQRTLLPTDITGTWSPGAIGLLGSELVIVALVDDPVQPRTEAFIHSWPLPLQILN